MIITNLCLKLYLHFKLIKRVIISAGVMDRLGVGSRWKIWGQDETARRGWTFCPPRRLLLGSTNPTSTNHKWTQSL